jgi:hypothetical protein
MNPVTNDFVYDFQKSLVIKSFPFGGAPGQPQSLGRWLPYEVEGTVENRTLGIAGIVDSETAQLAASVPVDTAAFYFCLGPDERALFKCIQSGQTVEQLAKNLNFPEAQIREAIVEAVRILAFYAIGLRRGRAQAARLAGE